MTLIALLLKENVFYETSFESDGKRKEKPVQALALGYPQVLKVPTTRAHTIGDLIEQMYKPTGANAFTTGPAGESYGDSYPIAVQFYHKL